MSNLILFSTIGIYFCIMIIVGLFALKKRKIGNVTDFFNGGRSLGSLVVIMTFLATLFSAYTFVGLPGYFYTHGIGSFAFMAFIDMLIVIPTYLFGRKVWEMSKKYDAISPVEILTKRYNSKTVTLLGVLVSVIFTIPILALQIVGVGKLITGVTNGSVSFIFVAAVMLIFILIYSRLGGMRSVAWTDTLQGIIMLILIYVIAFSFLNISFEGSLSNMFSRLIADGQGSLLTLPGPSNFFTYQILISFFFIFIFIPLYYPLISQRLIIFKNKKELKKLVLFFPILAFLIFIPTVIIGLGAANVFPGLESGDYAFSEVLNLLENPYISALAVVGIIAAAMSSVDSMLLVVGAILSRDLYKRFFRPNASSKKELWWSTTFIVITAIIAFIVALNPPNLIVELGILSSAGFVQLVPAYIGGLFWKKVTKFGAICSIIVGLSSLLVFNYFINPFFGFHPGFLGLVFGSLTIIIISKLTYKKNYLPPY
ncbi:sodium:solute symporter family protein [archaeon]|jgi:solute:Na+ symporter, SSS family|nr:sodium:solute symporter family protein [archaeon]